MTLSLPKFSLLLTAALIGGASLSAAAESEKVSFSKDVRPILSANCFKCHGPDDAMDENGKSLRKADLRLDIAAEQDWKELVARITSTDPDEIMPPPETNKTLTTEQIALLKDWIEQDAPYELHWAFVAPKKSPVPTDTHPIDNLFKGRLAEKADPYTLIRRLYLDLIGLPPSVEQADAFAADPSPEAYEKIVDSLLASPRYGERWARRWLDLARYADTNGYEKDRDRSIWPYRDYVIRSLNEDKGFDQFTIEQLAGDMLPNATPEQIVATGFHRNTMLNEEGGIDPLEFRYHAMTDRVATTGTVWLGLTTGCAQCHTHKYDPITHHDYFGLFAYLNNTIEPDYFIPEPGLAERQKENFAEAEELLADLAKHWPPSSGDRAFEAPSLDTVTTSGGSEATLDGSTVLISGPAPDKDSYTVTFDSREKNIDTIRLETLPFDGQGPGRTEHGNFVLTELEITAAPLDNSGPPQEIELSAATADQTQDSFPVTHAIDGDPATGWAIHDPNKPLHQAHHADFRFSAPVEHASGTRFTVTLRQDYGSKHTIGKFQLAVGSALQAVESSEEALQKSYQTWLVQQQPHLVPWQTLTPDKTEATTPYLTVEENGIIFAAGDIQKLETYTLEFPASAEAISSLRLEALPDERLPGRGPGMTYFEGRSGDFFLSEITLKSSQNHPIESSSQAQGDGAESAPSIQLAHDGDIQTGWSPGNDIGLAHFAVFNLADPLPANTPFTVTLTFSRHYPAPLGKFRLSSSPQPDLKAISNHGTFEEFLLQAPELKDLTDKIRGLQKPLTGTPTLVMNERPAGRTRPTHLHHRGEYTQPKELVEPRLPAAIYPPDRPLPKDRLGLARWLVSPENPLTARVVVNRHWAAFFGTGIVPTLADFGMQGDLPTQPELLDQLAVTFMENGWSFKKLHRLIVTSKVYQQDSKIESGTSKQFPRQRLEAEIIRDAALQASGLLSEKMFGPPVRPPQPEAARGANYSKSVWTASTGEDRFRRSVYTYQQRTSPFAMFTTFDAGSGEACLAQRDRSNTPLQALTLMNDPMFIEIAEHYGELLEKTEGTPEEKITLAFRRLLTRPPKEDEVRLLSDFHQKHPSWPALARAILSLDESVTKN